MQPSTKVRHGDHIVLDAVLMEGYVVIDYYNTIEVRNVLPDVEPGYLRKLLPDAAPEEGESWDEIQRDISSKIMPGLTHWWVRACNAISIHPSYS